jgi:hypothetical protein
MADQPALVLEDPAVSHGEPVHFSGFPGLWVVGEPVAVWQLGFDNDDAAFARAEELALPLVQTTVPAGEGAMPDMGGRMPSLDQVRGTDWKPKPGEPGAQLAPGEVFPPDPARPEEEVRLTESLLDLNAPDAVLALAAVDDPAELDALAAAEKAGANRKTVNAAISARQKDLASWGTGTEPAAPEGGSLGGNA